eukprot:14675083-Alexandrium_andersonii.AAC.1
MAVRPRLPRPSAALRSFARSGLAPQNSACTGSSSPACGLARLGPPMLALDPLHLRLATPIR